MHVSLDSALGRQRRLNSVGESVLQIAPSAAAAYSLRSLTGGDPKVVRVRRGSDNHEQDFTASEVSSGALTSFVNAQVTPPLDIQALSATGRDGDFLIAKAAYSLRSLGTRQATLAATGDTVARADGKFVAQVRRSSDDALKSFTADEVTDGTLLAFVGTGGSDNGFVKTWYDQSVTNQAGDTATGNHAVQATAGSQPKIVNAGSLVVDSAGLPEIDFDGSNDCLTASSYSRSGEDLPLTMISVFNQDVAGIDYVVALNQTNNNAFDRILLRTDSFEYGRRATDNTAKTGSGSDPDADTKYLFTAINSGTTSSGFVDGSSIFSGVDTNVGTQALNQIDIGLNNGDSSGGNNPFDGKIQEIIIYETDQTDNRTAIEANIGEVYSIDLPSGVDPGFDQVDGFVDTWYDQSGNSNDAVQATAGNQPKIVEAGSLLADGLTFDGSDDKLDIPNDLIASINSASSFLVAKSNTLSGSRIALALSHSTSNFRFYSGALLSSKFHFGYQNTALKIELSSADTNKHLFTSIAGSSNAEGFLDGTSKGTASSVDGKSTLSSGGIGAINTGNFWSGTIEEVIIYDSDQRANRVALETNIQAAYPTLP